MELKRRMEKKGTVLSITGVSNVSACESAKLRDQLEHTLVVRGMRYIVDFDEVTDIDCTGLSALISFYQRVRKNSGALILVGLKNSARLIFELTRLHEVFSFSTTVDTALSTVVAS